MPSQILYKNSWIGLVNVVHLCTPGLGSVLISAETEDANESCFALLLTIHFWRWSPCVRRKQLKIIFANNFATSLLFKSQIILRLLNSIEAYVKDKNVFLKTLNQIIFLNLSLPGVYISLL